MNPQKVLLIGDSRVRRLGEFAAKHRHDLFIHCDIVSFSGKALSFIIGELLEILKHTKYGTVIVLAGVNDLNIKRNNSTFECRFCLADFVCQLDLWVLSAAGLQNSFHL